MKVLQYVEAGRVELIELPTPEPGAGQVLVKVLAVNTCPHWDLHVMAGEPMFPGHQLTYPYSPGQPGHEAAGEVVCVGPGVTSPDVGNRVVMWRDRGHHLPGCYAQFVVVDVEHVLEAPASLAPAQVASLELAMCVQACFDDLLKIADVSSKRFAVSGLGPAGLVAAQLARAYGAGEVVGIDPLPTRRALAEELGVDRVCAPGDGALRSGRHSPDAFDVAMDCTGLPASIQPLMDSTRTAVSVFGVLREDVRFGWSHWAGLRLLGAAAHNREAAEAALEHVLAGRLDLRPLVTCQLPLAQYAEGVDMLRQKKALKICYLPWA